MELYLGPFKAIQERYFISLPLICQKSTVCPFLRLLGCGILLCETLTLYFVFAGRGGQSALRFARLRMEKRHNYVRKVAEVATQLYISNDKVNIAGLILAGSADFKTELSQSDMFDPVSKG